MASDWLTIPSKKAWPSPYMLALFWVLDVKDFTSFNRMARIVALFLLCQILSPTTVTSKKGKNTTCEWLLLILCLNRFECFHVTELCHRRLIRHMIFFCCGINVIHFSHFLKETASWFLIVFLLTFGHPICAAILEFF